MKDLTIIIPVGKWDDDTKKYLDRALDSVFTQTIKPLKILFGVSNNVFINEEFKEHYNKTVEEFKQVDIIIDINVYPETYKFEYYPNNCVQQLIDDINTIDTKYFSILEPTDQFESTWFENVKRYIESSDKDISIYLPICKVFNGKNEFVRFLNEQWWANGFSKDLELGYIDEEGLKLMFDMNLTGAIFNKKDFDEVGGLKNNIKLYYWYEFLLRLVYNNKNAFVIPKSLYNHVYFKAEDIDEKEARFYWDSVQEEYYFSVQRELTYNS